MVTDTVIDKCSNITDSTVIFYKDTYDNIYKIDREDHNNCRDVWLCITILTPRILGQPEKSRIQNNILYKYGTIDVTQQVLSYHGLTGAFNSPYYFISSTPASTQHVGKRVKIRNYHNGVIYVYDAVIESVGSDLHTIKIANKIDGQNVITYTGMAHISFDNSYYFSGFGNAISEDYIRVSYDCNDDAVRCGSRVTSVQRFRFGPVDNFRVHLDNCATDLFNATITAGSAFVDGVSGDCVWATLAGDGSVVVNTGETVLTWLSVWGP
jgi:hypothetical protein